MSIFTGKRALEERVEWYQRRTLDAMKQEQKAQDNAQNARTDASRARSEASAMSLRLDSALAENARLVTEREVIIRAITGRRDIVQRFIELDILQNGAIR